MVRIEDLTPNIRAEYTAMRVLPDGRICGVHRLLFHWTMHVDIDPIGYRERYCFFTLKLALAALNEWDGTGDPPSWHRHPESGRRRNVDTGAIWRDGEIDPSAKIDAEKSLLSVRGLPDAATRA